MDKRWLCLLIVAGVFVFIAFFGSTILNWTLSELVSILFNYDPRMNRKQIERYLQVKFPADASHISIDAEDYDETWWIRFSFEASPESALAFAHQFCDGVLHEGFNPFESANYDENTVGKVYLFKFFGYTFSSAPNAPNTSLGNACFDTTLDYSGYVRGYPIKILVDTSDPAHYRVRFTEENFGPNSPSQVNYVTPAADLPFMIIGVSEKANRITLVTDEICFDMRSGYYVSETVDYPDLAGQQVRIFVDNELVTATRAGKYLGLDRSENKDFSFHCYSREWESGKHTLELYLGEIETSLRYWAWDFYVE